MVLTPEEISELTAAEEKLKKQLEDIIDHKLMNDPNRTSKVHTGFTIDVDPNQFSRVVINVLLKEYVAAGWNAEFEGQDYRGEGNYIRLAKAKSPN